MIVAIDGYEANVSNRVGSGRYAYEILTHIYKTVIHRKSKSGLRDSFSFRVYLPEQPLPDMPQETDWWRYRIAAPKRLWTLVGLPVALTLDQPWPNVVFTPTHYIPRWISPPRVMSIMDVSYLHFPELFLPKDIHQLTHWTKYSARHSKRILTISSFSRHAIIEAYQVPADHVVVTYPGMTDLCANSMNSEETARKFGISVSYILSVGTLQPRKNYVRLIEAFSKFLLQNKQKFGRIELVIVGKKGWLWEEILSASERFGVADRVKFLDFISDSDLANLYSNALCLAMPSLYEGFGLPVLEAMAYKCPIVVSDRSSLPEIAGKAGVYVNPDDVTSIASGLLTAVGQRNLLQGKGRIEEGLKQVKKFSWEAAAKQTLDVLADVASGGRA